MLTDIRPDADGYIVLSLHTFEGLRVYPSYIQLDTQSNPVQRDPVDHIRLKILGPVPRLTLVWERP